MIQGATQCHGFGVLRTVFKAGASKVEMERAINTTS